MNLYVVCDLQHIATLLFQRLQLTYTLSPLTFTMHQPTTLSIHTLVQLIHDMPTQVVLAISGAGHSALSHLLDVAGASRTLLEGIIPYCNAAFDDFLGDRPDQYVSAKTARRMAGRAYTRARHLTEGEQAVIGVGCTATIATDRIKRGDHRAHIVLWQPEQLIELYLLMEKEKRTRSEEEDLVGRVILNVIAQGCNLQERVALAIDDNDLLEINTIDYNAPIDALINGNAHFIGTQADGMLYPTGQTPMVILSGSFNPLHEGHLGMARAAEQLLGERATFELSAVNVDKPPLPAPIIRDRMGQFAGQATILASDAPTYLGKAQLYPGATFVVGYDTAVRIFAPRYYGNSERQMLDALQTIRDLGCHFLVAGRIDESGNFRSLNEITIPTGFESLFTAIPEQIFRRDISSTELRAQHNTNCRL